MRVLLISLLLSADTSTHYQRFDMSCKRIAREGLLNQDDISSNNFETRGFV